MGTAPKKNSGLDLFVMVSHGCLEHRALYDQSDPTRYDTQTILERKSAVAWNIARVPTNAAPLATTLRPF